MKSIRDPLRETYIPISEEFLAVVDSPEVQRLRRIHQLGFSSLVYPGATHTRFLHTLGVFWMTNRFLDTLDLHNTDISRQIKLAALLHDTGHGPYSHAVEALEGVKDHEQISCEITEDLSERGVIREGDVEPIQEFIQGSPPRVLNGDIDADRMDYLSRDAHYTGISHGEIDSETIIGSATLMDGSIVFDERSIQAIEGLLISRKNMHGSVYSHPTVRSAEKMLVECVDRYEEIDGDEIYSHCDKTLHTELARSDDPIINKLYERITTRNLYKTAFCLRQMHDIDPSSIDHEDFYNYVQAEVEAPEHEIFIDWYTQKPKDLSINVLVDDEIVDFDKVSNVNTVIHDNGYSVQMSAYSPAEIEDEVNAACKKYLGIE